MMNDSIIWFYEEIFNVLTIWFIVGTFFDIQKRYPIVVKAGCITATLNFDRNEM